MNHLDDFDLGTLIREPSLALVIAVRKRSSPPLHHSCLRECSSAIGPLITQPVMILASLRICLDALMPYGGAVDRSLMI